MTHNPYKTVDGAVLRFEDIGAVEADAPIPTTSTTAILDRLYADHFGRLVSSLHAAFGAGPPEPEDVAQRAFTKLAARGEFDEIKNLKAFLWRTAHNIAISEKRSQGVHTKYVAETDTLFSPLEGDILTPERVLESRERLSLILDALRKMPERRRRAFVLNRIEGLNYTQVSKRIGIGRTAVTKHVARATADIDAALSAQSDPEG